MSRTNRNDPAAGLTVREHFAAMALQGLMSAINLIEIEEAVSMSVIAADLLINELNKES